jgi:cell division protein FtsQ
MLLNINAPRLRYDRILWVIFLVVVGFILLTAVARKRNDFARDTAVEVMPLAGGNKLISEGDVKQALLRSFGNTLEGTELRHLEVERMERELEKDPFVADAETYIDQQSNLHVRIEQREPLLRILDKDGGNYYLDGNGAKMPPSKNFAARVLVATGNIPAYTIDFQKTRRNKLRDLFALAKTLLDDPFFSTFIQQIHINNNQEFVLVPLVGDQKIIIGNVRRLEEKLSRLRIFYKEGMPYAGWRKYSTIDVRYAGQVVCRK